MRPSTVKKYTEAGINPEDPDARVQYYRWRKRQQQIEDHRSSKPDNVPVADRRLFQNPTMAPIYEEDAKLQEWAAEIHRLSCQQKESRRQRRKSDVEAERLFEEMLKQQEKGIAVRKRIAATKTRLTHFRDMARRRRAAIANKIAFQKTNELRKELGLPPRVATSE